MDQAKTCSKIWTPMRCPKASCCHMCTLLRRPAGFWLDFFKVQSVLQLNRISWSRSLHRFSLCMPKLVQPVPKYHNKKHVVSALPLFMSVLVARRMNHTSSLALLSNMIYYK